MSTSFDVLIIGGGPGGYVAALRAAQLKMRTALIEREHLGGICLNWGCIPTKSLLHTADTLRRIRHAPRLGVSVGEPVIDFARVMQRSREVAQRLNRGVMHLLRKAGVTVVNGEAAFAPGRTIRVLGADASSQSFRAEHAIIATGARARPLPMLPFDGGRVWSYRDALSARELPKSLLVIGAGAIGMEFASFYASLGCRVTVIEAQSRPLPSSDADVSEFVAQQFARDGIQLHVGARLERADFTRDGVRVTVQTHAGPQALEAERVLVAVGLAANTEALALEHTQVVLERGFVVADATGATAAPWVHAIGDVTGAPMLAHRASHQALACVEPTAAGAQGPDPLHHPPLIPSCVYSKALPSA